MSRWKWTEDIFTDVEYDEQRQEWEELEEEAFREEEKHRNQLVSDYHLDLFPEEENK